MPFIEEGGEPALSRALGSGRLVLASGPEVISESDAVVLVLATPIDSHMSPCFRAIDDVLQSYRPYLRDGQLLILRSTLYPGTATRVNRRLSDNGFEIDLAVCPERLAQGRGLAELFALPQIISAFSKKGLARTRTLFSALNDDLVEMEPLEAELSKLFTNAWRYIKFAVANQYRSFILIDGLRKRLGIPHARGNSACLSATAIFVRLSKTLLRILRTSCVGTVRVTIHNCPAIQLRRRRRRQSVERPDNPIRQCETGDESRTS